VPFKIAAAVAWPLLVTSNSFSPEEKKIRERYICPWTGCNKEYANKFSPHALKHFHAHFRYLACQGDLKKQMVDYARSNGIMKVLQKKNLVQTELVAG